MSTKKPRGLFLGSFNTDVEAAIACNIAAKEFLGEFARLNDVMATSQVVAG